ncbi:MAG: hypothetical protein WC815_15035 [Vicinamibacterales bacterium]
MSVNCGVRLIVTGKVQDAERLSESVAVHVTVVAPSGKVELEAGVHATATGSLPPLAVGVVNVTAVPLADVVLAVIGAGQVSVGGSGVGVGVGVGSGIGVGVGVGAVGPLHAPATAVAHTTARSHVCKNPIRRRDIKDFISVLIRASDCNPANQADLATPW